MQSSEPCATCGNPLDYQITGNFVLKTCNSPGCMKGGPNPPDQVGDLATYATLMDMSVEQLQAEIPAMTDALTQALPPVE